MQYLVQISAFNETELASARTCLNKNPSKQTALKQMRENTFSSHMYCFLEGRLFGQVSRERLSCKDNFHVILINHFPSLVVPSLNFISFLFYVIRDLLVIY